MPFPFTIVGAALAAGALVKVAKSFLRNEDPRDGYCTWCGKNAKHNFHADGLTWAKTGPIALLTGGIGTAIASVLSRSVYKCTACGKRTLPCRWPGCSRMARSASVYDDEFCGVCFEANNIHAERAAKECTETEKNKLVKVLRAHEALLREREVECRNCRAADTQRIESLMKVITRDRETITQLRKALGFPPEAWA